MTGALCGRPPSDADFAQEDCDLCLTDEEPEVQRGPGTAFEDVVPLGLTLVLRPSSSPLLAFTHKVSHPTTPSPSELSPCRALRFYPCCFLLPGGHLFRTLTGPADSCRSAFGPQR